MSLRLGLGVDLPAASRGGAPVPAAPTGVVATGGTVRSISIAFDVPPAGVTSMNVYRGTSSGTETLLASGVSTTSPYVDSAATSDGQTYYYTLTAVNSVGESPQSGETSATTFYPKTIANLAVWIKADAGTFKDAGTTPCGNGDTCQQWNDQSGNGHNATQSGSTARPVFTTNVQNGLPGLLFDGSNDVMRSGAGTVTLNQPSWLFAVFKVVSHPAGDHTMFEGHTTNSARLYLDSNGGMTGYAGSGLNDNFAVANSPYIAAVRYNGNSGWLQINNRTVKTGAIGSNSATDYQVGGETGVQFANIYVLEFIRYTGDIGTTNAALVQSYLNTRWAVY